jgi:crossover junction endodeoxyribonuclease RuvC
MSRSLRGRAGGLWMRVIGVDPGSAVTGFGVVEGRGGAVEHIAAGVIRPNSRAAYPDKLLTIYQRLCDLIARYTPDAMSLERSFVAANVQSAFRLGEARAMALLAAADNRLELFEYAPAHVKLTVAGHGRADKSQVKFMVRRRWMRRPRWLTTLPTRWRSRCAI